MLKRKLSEEVLEEKRNRSQHGTIKKKLAAKDVHLVQEKYHLLQDIKQNKWVFTEESDRENSRRNMAKGGSAQQKKKKSAEIRLAKTCSRLGH